MVVKNYIDDVIYKEELESEITKKTKNCSLNGLS